MSSRQGFGPLFFALVLGLAVSISAKPARATASLFVIQGSGELASLQTSTTVNGSQALFFAWETDEASATGGSWKIRQGSPSGPVVSKGDSSPAPAPKPGQLKYFTIPASGPQSFLTNPAPATPVTYYATITPHNAANAQLGSASASVKIIEVVAAPQKPVTFGPSANLPTVELVHYAENIGSVPDTQILYADATLTVKAVNNSGAATDPVYVSILDANALMRQTSPPQKVSPLKPGQASAPITIKLTANLSAPQSQTPQEQQFHDWNQLRDIDCGVDLMATIDWAGPQAQAPIGDHNEVYLYRGYGSSKPWQENHPVTTQSICDGKNCVALNQVARNLYSRLACNVVGYAFFVGDNLSGSRGILDAFGDARTSFDPPETGFTPTTRMQIASASKVLTSLAAIKVLGSNFDKPAVTFFPPGWQLQNSIVKNITSRAFVSQTSGVMDYDAGTEDDASLETFFTQTLAHPDAPADCYGKNPIVVWVQGDNACYSNANYSLMRVVMPRAAGTNSSDPGILANTYVTQVQNNVFKPVGVTDPNCTGGGSDALGYNFPVGGPGTNFGNGGDLSLSCGDWGWWVSVEDYARVLLSLNAQDGKILNKSCGLGGLYDMVTNPPFPVHAVGWDERTDGTHRWVEKNGGDTWISGGGSGQVSTSVVLYGGQDGCVSTMKDPPPKPVAGVAAVLFINSNLKGSDPAGIFSHSIAARGPIALSGAFVSGSVAKFNFQHSVVAVSSAAGDEKQTLTITGIQYGKAISETITLNGTKAVSSANVYDTVTKIVAGGSGYPTAGSISIGTNSITADTLLLSALQAATTTKP